MPNLTLLSTPLTRTIQFDKLDDMGVDLCRPIFSRKTKLILGYPMTGKPDPKTVGLKARKQSKT
jgi:hypothetical protein